MYDTSAHALGRHRDYLQLGCLKLHSPL